MSLYSVLQAGNELSMEESFELIRWYVNAVQDGDSYDESMINPHIWRMLECEEFTTMGHFEALILPLLEWFKPSSAMSMNRSVIAKALQHNDCPPYVLSEACRCSNRWYALSASWNKACPVEDATFAALRYG